MAASPRITTEVVTVTPSMASELLAVEAMNRPINRAKVRQYAKDMQDGTFPLTGDSIKIGKGGAVLDGQHRLQAVVESGVSMTCVIVRGLEFADVFDRLDGHRPRSLNDVLSIMGVQHAKHMAACTVACYWFDETGVPYASAGGSTHRYAAYYKEHKRELEAGSEFLVSNTKRATLVGLRPTFIGMGYVVFGRLDADDRDEFLRVLLAGTNLSESSPIFRLRERMIRNRQATVTRIGRRGEAALLFKAWNHWRAGNELKQLAWRPENEPFPVPE